MQLRKKLPLVMIATTVVPLLLVILVFTVATNISRTSQMKGIIGSYARLQAEYLESMFNERAADVTVLSHMSTAQQLFAEEGTVTTNDIERAAGKEIVQEMMDAWMRENSYLRRVSLVNMNNMVVMCTHEEALNRVSELRAYDLQNMKKTKNRIAYVVSDSLTNEKALLLAQPITVNGSVVGCVQFWIELSYFSTLAKEDTMFETGETVILDDYKNVVLNTSELQMERITDIAGVSDLSTLLVMYTAKDGTFQFETNGEAGYAYYYRFNASNWVVLYTVKQSELNLPVGYNIAAAVFTIALITLMTLYLTRFIRREFTVPITKLSQAVARMQDGDYVTNVPYLGEAEFGNVGVAFNRLMQHIRNDHRELAIREERQRIANEQSNSVVMEYNLETKMLECSPNANEFNNFPLCTQNFPENFAQMVVHPEDEAAYSTLVREMMQRRRQSNLDVRLLTYKNEYRWFRLLLTTIKDKETCRPLRIIFKATDVHEEKEENARLTSQAKTDPLTGLYNKAATQTNIEACLATRKENEFCALLLLDMDHFKDVNDTYGHQRGDRVIVDAAAAIAGTFRAGDIVGRIGGDEFMVLLTHLSARSMLETKLQQLKAAICAVKVDEESNKTMTASIGVAVSPDDGETFQRLYAAADIALYNVKKDGRNGYKIFEQPTQQ